MKKVTLLCTLLFIAVASYTQIFLEVSTLQGNTPQGQPVLSYSFGASNPVTMGGPGSGGGAGKASFSSFNFMMQKGKMSTEILKALAKGTHFATATIKIYSQSGNGKGNSKSALSYQITLSEVLVESFQQSMGCGSKECEGPTETVSLAYSKIKIEDFESNTWVEHDIKKNSTL